MIRQMYSIRKAILHPAQRYVSNLTGSHRWLHSTSTLQASYGFIGLGQMGYAMAKNLQKKLSVSDQLQVYDVNEKRTAEFQEETSSGEDHRNGAIVRCAADEVDAVQDADFVLTVLPEPSHVHAVFKKIYSSNRSFNTSQNESKPQGKPRVYIDCSTIDPTSSRQVADLVRKREGIIGSQFVDAPMSGGVVGADAGTLTFMVGAADDTLSSSETDASTSSLYRRIEPILLLMGRRVFSCGSEPGSGLAAKLANNYLLAINNVATAEAMNLGIKWGLDPNRLAHILNESTGRCWPSAVNNPVPGVNPQAPSSRDYEGGFGVTLMKKDAKLARKMADEVKAKLILGKEMIGIYEQLADDHRYQKRDFSVVYRYLQRNE